MRKKRQNDAFFLKNMENRKFANYSNTTKIFASISMLPF